MFCRLKKQFLAEIHLHAEKIMCILFVLLKLKIVLRQKNVLHLSQKEVQHKAFKINDF